MCREMFPVLQIPMPRQKYTLEVCTDSVESAVIAAQAGADRLELCSNLVIGGTTPTQALFSQVRKKCDLRIHVLIRPRFGDFCYTEDEFAIILEEIKAFRSLGADGIVIGALTPDGEPDCKEMEKMKKCAGDMWVTLHRAFDMCRDPYVALEQAYQLGINSILTSGQADSCMEGAECIRSLVRQSAGKIEIMAGGGVNAEVIRKMHEITGASAYHMSGKTVLDSPMRYRRANVHMGLPGISEYDIWRTDAGKIKEAADMLRSFH